MELSKKIASGGLWPVRLWAVGTGIASGDVFLGRLFADEVLVRDVLGAGDGAGRRNVLEPSSAISPDRRSTLRTGHMTRTRYRSMSRRRSEPNRSASASTLVVSIWLVVSMSSTSALVPGAAPRTSRAGARVIVLDKRFEWGGTMSTDDYSTPFLYHIGQYLLQLGRDLPPYADLGLADLGIRFVEPELWAAFVPVSGGEPLVIRRGGGGLGELTEAFAAVDHLVKPLLYVRSAPVDEVEQLFTVGEGKRVLEPAHLTPAGLPDTGPDARAGGLLRYLCAEAGFHAADEPIGILGAFALSRPFSASIVVGGNKALAAGLFRAAARSGAQFRSVADVVTVRPAEGELTIGCSDGREFRVRAVVSTLDPKTTFLELLEAGVVPEGIRQAAQAWRLDRTGPFTADYGIKGELPRLATDYASLALVQVLGFDDAASVADLLDRTDSGELVDPPAGHLAMTTLHDRTQAALGPFGPLHTMRLETLAPYTDPTGAWVPERAAHRARCWEALTAQTSGLVDGRPLFAFADTPQDIERRFRTTRNGSLRHGALAREQTFTNPPASGLQHDPDPGQRRLHRRRRCPSGDSRQPGRRVPRSRLRGPRVPAVVAVPAFVREATEHATLPAAAVPH